MYHTSKQQLSVKAKKTKANLPRKNAENAKIKVISKSKNSEPRMDTNYVKTKTEEETKTANHG